MDPNETRPGGMPDAELGGPASGRSGAAIRAQERLSLRMREAAERIGSAADRLEEIAEERLSEGPLERAGRLAHSLAGSMDSVAGYLREGDADTLRRDLERRVRERPLQSLLLGVAAGWVVGKILR